MCKFNHNSIGIKGENIDWGLQGNHGGTEGGSPIIFQSSRVSKLAISGAHLANSCIVRAIFFLTTEKVLALAPLINSKFAWLHGPGGLQILCTKFYLNTFSRVASTTLSYIRRAVAVTPINKSG